MNKEEEEMAKFLQAVDMAFSGICPTCRKSTVEKRGNDRFCTTCNEVIITITSTTHRIRRVNE